MDDMLVSDRDADPEFELARFTPYRIALAAQMISDALARQYRKRFDISTSDWRVLVHLANSGGASVRDIEGEVAMEKSKVSRATTRLEARGYVAKRQGSDDKRLVHLSLTPAGRRVMDELLPLAAEFQERTKSILGRDFAGFEKGLQKLIDAIEDNRL